MKPQETKFSFVYNEIKQCILEGQILPGNSLPSSRVLCEQFHVSRYTINRVLEALREENLIEIRPRLAPIVILRKDASEPSDALSEILSQKDSILQIYQTFAIIMPALLPFAMQNCDIEIMPHYKQARNVSQFGNSAGGWRSSFNLGYDILKIGGNSLFSELYSTIVLHGKLTFFTEQCPYFCQVFLQGSVSVTGTIMDILKGEHSSIMHVQLSNIYQKLTSSIADTLDHLSDVTLACPTQNSTMFLWNPVRGRDYCYSKIVTDLNHKIGSGEYSVGMYLPYEKQLANHYGVSLSTVRKALTELEQRGFVKKLNGRGTVVIEPDDTKLSKLMLNAGYAEMILRYFYAQQLMVLVIFPAALAAAPGFTKEDLDELADKTSSPGSIYLADLFLILLKHTTLEPLRVILAETSRLLDWGYYLTYYSTKRRTIPHLNRQVRTALEQLREGNFHSFAEGVADCYRYILACTKRYMVEKYNFKAAANIRIPEKY